MKCQKCGATNIQEAVFCGMCGTRLKHPKTIDDFTGRSKIQSSVKRDNNSKLKRPKSGYIATPAHTTLSTRRPIPAPHTNTRTQNSSIQEKAQILLKSWQEQFKKKLERGEVANKEKTKNSPKQLKFIILWLIFIFFAGPLFTFFKAGLPWLLDKFDIHPRSESMPAENATAVGDDQSDTIVAETATTSEFDHEIAIRYKGIQMMSIYVTKYYEKYQKFPSDLTAIAQLNQTEYSSNFFKEIEIQSNGLIIGNFEGHHEMRLYYVPVLENNTISDWQCYALNIPANNINACKQLQQDPFKSS